MSRLDFLLAEHAAQVGGTRQHQYQLSIRHGRALYCMNSTHGLNEAAWRDLVQALRDAGFDAEIARRPEREPFMPLEVAS